MLLMHINFNKTCKAGFKKYFYCKKLLTLVLLNYLLLFFHSFEAEIANTISSFKWMKINIIYEK